ncbi:hypothetical protein DFP72DRAFT_1022965 [Ephemerocybe angulata]|uniref:Protein kinase domain-containing protein n=1 Tax=Ephemerocybe angulata TaxID=980116 RepID=A0A8H6HA88_9AGAR|nr:hypothetical protein DFP72DRAFT_1022965 [Tulosesus angulatus]
MSITKQLHKAEKSTEKSRARPETRNFEAEQCGVDCGHSQEPIHSNITQIHRDLEKTQDIRLKTMLKAMIMLKSSRDDKSQAKPSPAPEEIFEYGEAQLRALVEEAVTFCNDATRSRKFIDKLEELLRGGPKASPCDAIASGLNDVLIDFHKRDVGQLKRCPDEDLTLYNVGSNMLLDSELLMEASDYKSKSKPDVYESRVKDLFQSAAEFENLTFGELAASLETKQSSKSPASGRKDPETRNDWSNIISSLEVKAGQGSRGSLLRAKWKQGGYSSAANLNDDLTNQCTRGVPGTAVPSCEPSPDCDHKDLDIDTRRGLKREREQEDSVEEPSSKKSRTSSSGGSRAGPLWSVHPGRLPSEIQCAFYGLELLRSRWDRTHSIVMSFLDDHFSLRWYDSQGCIRTQEISVCGEELPLVVATIVLLQRVQGTMRGTANVDLKATVGGKEVCFELPRATRARWEVRGRRPVAVRPLARQNLSDNFDTSESEHHSSAVLEDCFFKWYWREENRSSEKQIVDTAKERAVRYLPREHISDVLNHLPVIHGSEVYKHLSTRHIRELCQLGTDGALVPCAMMSQRLLPMEKTFQPQEVEVRLWDILRCLTLLWTLGVTHGDISLDNIMATPPNKDGRKYIVLNDFDLATVMNPGDESPPKSGNGMGGTKPFMALEVLGNADGSIKRVLHQELESTFWSLAWYCHREWDWNIGTYFDVRNRKMDWIHERLYRNPDIDMGKEYFPLLRKIGALLYIEDLELMKLKTKILEGPEEEGAEFKPRFFTELPHIARPAKDFLLLCDKAFPRDEEYKSWSWMDFTVDTCTRTSP